MLTLSMIVKNEERYLEDCLKSVRGAADEIIIVDTGSTDRTKSIAKQYGASVYDFKWADDFSAARNYALERSNGDWILYLDADERISPESIDELKRITSCEKKEGIYCRVVSIDDVKRRPSVMSYVRLFPKHSDVKFEGAVHEQIEYSILRSGFEIKDSGIEIIHIGYNIEEDGIRKKAGRNLAILKKEYEREGSSYYALQLAQTYGILHDKINAVRYFKIALKDEELRPEYKSVAYRYLAVDKAESSDWRGALELINKSLKSDEQQPLALLVAANVHLKLKNPEEASKYSLRAYDVNKNFLTAKRKSHQAILMDEEGILFECLNVAMSAGNLELFKYYFGKLKEEITSIHEPEKLNELNLFDTLLNDKEIDDETAQVYLDCVNAGNLDIVVTLLSAYKRHDTKIFLLKGISKRYPENSVILNRLGLALSDAGRLSEAEDVFSSSMKANVEDPGTVFYMISVYLKRKKVNEIVELLELADRRFAGRNEVISRLTALKQKLGILHQN